MDLKGLKNTEARSVPLLPEVREQLLELADTAEAKYGEGAYLFYGLLKDKPIDGKFLLAGLKDACTAAGIDADKRGIVFHSHRHFYAARMADDMTAEQVPRITGHKSLAVFEEYADHIEAKNLDAMRNVAARKFGNILKFRPQAEMIKKEA
jgi:integrase